MSDFLIRDIPEPLKKRLAEKAKAHGRSLSDEAKLLLRRALADEGGSQNDASPSAYQSIRHAFAGAMMTDADHVDFMDTISQGRAHEGRSVPEFE